MDVHVKDVVREMSKASDEERITFPEVVKALRKVGIKRYHADLIVGRKTYYLPDGDFEEVEVHKVEAAASEFSAKGVEQAVGAMQQQVIGYRQFCRLIANLDRVASVEASPGAPISEKAGLTGQSVGG